MSHWVKVSTSGLKRSKNAAVSGGVLYIFQLPAMMRRLIYKFWELSFLNVWEETEAGLNRGAEILRHCLSNVGEALART